MQTIKVLLLQQSSYQEMIRFFQKEMDHFSVAPSENIEQPKKPVEVLLMKPLYINSSNTPTLVFEPLPVEELAQPVKAQPEFYLSSDDRQKLHEVKRIIEQHFLQEHTIASLCRQVGMNEFKLKKGFKALFNTRVIQYVRQRRMEYAKELLCNNHTSVIEVSRKLGFSYPNHFSTAYKKHFGIQPSQSQNLLT